MLVSKTIAEFLIIQLTTGGPLLMPHFEERVHPSLFLCSPSHPSVMLPPYHVLRGRTRRALYSVVLFVRNLRIELLSSRRPFLAHFI